MPPKRRQLAAAAATSMDLMWVNKDLLMEILLRLPAKSLIRFKSVCKKWLDLISSDYFCHQHTLRGPKLQHSLIIQMHTRQLFYFNPTTNGEKVMIPYTYTPDHHHHQIVEGCNGLLLLLFNPLQISRVQKRHHRNSYYVYNPTTKKSRKITLTISNNYPFVENITLAFDPSKSPYYKIVCVRSDIELNLYTCTYQIEVYDSESHTWKLGLGPFIHPVIFDGVHWNNSIYWTNIPLDSGHYCSFDIAKNEMKTLDSPPCPYPYKGLFRSVRCHLQESNGHLYHFEYLKLKQGRDPCLSVTVWELGGDNDDSQWLLKHHHEIHRQSHDVYPVRFVGGSDGDETCSLLTYEPKPEQGRMMAYNFLDKSYEPLVDLACQPPMFLDQLFMTCLQFGEVMALV